MDRRGKKLIYGFFYIAVLALVLWALAGVFIKSGESCFDGARNQDEIGVDCGGLCASCEEKNIEPMRVAGPVQVFGLSSGRAVALAEILNPNQDYDADNVTYRLNVYDSAGVLLETKEASCSVYSREKIHVYEPDISAKYDKIGRIDLEFLDAEWRRSNESLRPVLSEPQSVVTEVTGNSLKVSGLIRNQGSLPANDVRIIALIFDTFGSPIFASQTVISGLEPFKDGGFSVIFPSDDDIVEGLDREATKVFVTIK